MKTTNVKCGVHTPEESTKYLQQIIEGTKLEFECTSWVNNTTDSCAFEMDVNGEGQTWEIHFPNMTNPDEQYPGFGLWDEEQGVYLLDEVTIEEVIEYINKYCDVMKTALKTVERQIDDVFMDLHQEFDTKSGDITPEQENEMEELRTRMAELLTRQVMQNL